LIISSQTCQGVLQINTYAIADTCLILVKRVFVFCLLLNRRTIKAKLFETLCLVDNFLHQALIASMITVYQLVVVVGESWRITDLVIKKITWYFTHIFHCLLV
jgi:hypothetical protein